MDFPIDRWRKVKPPKYDGAFATINGKKHKTVTMDGVQRFKENRIVSAFQEAASNGMKFDMNLLWIMYQRGAFTRAEMMQFYRLIGYSVCGFEEVFGGMVDVDSSTWKDE